MATSQLSDATAKRHLSYEFITERERSPGEWGMRKHGTEKLTEVTEEYEAKAHLLPAGETRELIERLARVGRDELAKRDGEDY